MFNSGLTASESSNRSFKLMDGNVDLFKLMFRLSDIFSLSFLMIFKLLNMVIDVFQVYHYLKFLFIDCFQADSNFEHCS